MQNDNFSDTISNVISNIPKDKIALESIRRVLVIKLRHHGDVLLTSPVFSALKAHAPQVEMDALVYAETASMLTFHPAITNVFVIDRHWKKLGLLPYAGAEIALMRKLMNRHYDLILHLTDHPRGAWISRLCRAPFALAPKVRGRNGWWNNAFTHLHEGANTSKRHTVERHLDALRRIGIFPKEAEKRLVLIAGDKAVASVSGLLQEKNLADKNFIHLHPASRWTFKCWSVDKMAELISRLAENGQKIVITAAPDEAEIATINAILARVEEAYKDKITPFLGVFSLKEMAALTQKAALFIGVDSAPMHIAAAVNTPTVTLFGPSGEKEWGPWMVKARVITSAEHACRPCGIDGCGGSKKSDCLETLPVSRVFDAALELLPANL